jgi:hypothetical protein
LGYFEYKSFGKINKVEIVTSIMDGALEHMVSNGLVLAPICFVWGNLCTYRQIINDSKGWSRENFSENVEKIRETDFVETYTLGGKIMDAVFCEIGKNIAYQRLKKLI